MKSANFSSKMRVFENFMKSPGLSLPESKETDSAVIPHFPKLISNSNRSLSVEKSNPYKFFQKSIINIIFT